MVFLDRLGWPVERVKGRPVLNALRLLIHTRKIVWKWEAPKPANDPSVQASPGASQGECIHTPGVDCYSGDCCRRPSREDRGPK